MFKQENNGTLTLVGQTAYTSYTLTPTETGEVTYVIKASYSIFTNNASGNLEIKVNLGMDSNVDDIINPKPDDDDDKPNKPTEPDEKPDTGLE